MEGSNVPADYEPAREVWRSSFLRALVEETEEGSIAQVQRHANAHPQATHEFFTQPMTVWMLEDKTYPWYDFVGATALFVAAAYARKEVVAWLLAHGSDPTVMCKFPGMDLHRWERKMEREDVRAALEPHVEGPGGHVLVPQRQTTMRTLLLQFFFFFLSPLLPSSKAREREDKKRQKKKSLTRGPLFRC
jgi:hypothetical protein